jgi:hypothetical protein
MRSTFGRWRTLPQMAARILRRTVLFWADVHPERKGLSNFAGGRLALPHRFAGDPAESGTVEHFCPACKATDAARLGRLRAAPSRLAAAGPP